MSRIIPAGELDLIEQVINQYPFGLSIAELEKAVATRLTRPLNRRTLQRRLQQLLAKNRIITQGRSIALVYKPAPPTDIVLGVAEDTPQYLPSGGMMAETYIPVSKDGGIIRDLVRRPLIQRKPVGYERSFLDDYIPGETFYLPKSLRDQFHEMGSSLKEQRPAGTYAREIMSRLLIDLSWASSRLEGNTYNRLDTQNLIEFGRAAEGKDIQETQMILNHKAAIELLVEEAGQVGFNPFTIFNLHDLLAQNLLPDESACGRLRRRAVEIGGSVYHPLSMPQILEECFHLLLDKAAAIPDPFEQAFFVMVQMPYLQPFEDVNKRVSRLAANIPLIKNNLCPLSFVDLPERAYVDGILGVYELNQTDLLQDVFTWAYERSCHRYLAIKKIMAEPNPLRIRFREELIRVVQAVIRQQLPPSQDNVRQLAQALIPEAAWEVFTQMALDSLKNLHEGSVARYRLKLSEFQAWEPIRDRFGTGVNHQ